MKNVWRMAAMAAVATAMVLGAADEAQAQSRWHGDVMVGVSTDAMTDEAQYSVMTMSGPENPNRGDAGFGFYCERGGAAMVTFQITGFSVEDSRTLRLRWGTGQPERLHWSARQQGTNVMVYSRSRRDVNEMARKAAGAPRLAMRDEDGGTYIFSLNGMRSAFSAVPCLNP